MHGDRRIERKQARLYDETRPEGPDKDTFPDLPCQEAAVKNNAGGVKFYAPERVFDRKSSLQILDAAHGEAERADVAALRVDHCRIEIHVARIGAV